MCKTTLAEFLYRPALPILTILAIAMLAGCQQSTGPWGKQVYERPNVETPVHEFVVTPGAPLPFEQRLPAGNVDIASDTRIEQ